MRFLVTRPVEDAGKTASRLRALGHQVFLEPLLTIQFYENVDLQCDGLQALLATSANGVRALMARPDAALWKDAPLFAVGVTTAALAREVGFVEVIEAQGDVSSLSALVRQMCASGAGRLLHLSGVVSAGDLAGDLAQAGFQVEKAVLYEAVAAPSLSDVIVDALRAGEIDGVLLYSPRSAEIFVDLVKKAGLADICASLEAYCLSANAARPLRSLGFKALHIAERPNEEALFGLIGP
ncbi:MAG: uroporphyrinogen-III synthase [Parvibaculum sp.]